MDLLSIPMMFVDVFENTWKTRKWNHTQNCKGEWMILN